MGKKVLSGISYYLGIDGGGSKCRATLCTLDGEILGHGMGGPANPFRSIPQTIDSIAVATAEVLAGAGLQSSDAFRISAGVGLAGLNLPSFYQAVSEWSHPFRSMFLTTDLEIACVAAHDDRDGAVIVAGTGSSGYSTVNGHSQICGAHGFGFGDKGSGAWIGLEAIKAVLLAADDLGPATTLTDLVGRHVNASGVSIVEKMAGAGPREFARMAGLVFDAADAEDFVAKDIVKVGAEYLSALANKLWLGEPPRMSLLGGLRGKYLPWLDSRVVERLSPPLHQPDIGAVLFAHRKHAETIRPGEAIRKLQIIESSVTPPPEEIC